MVYGGQGTWSVEPAQTDLNMLLLSADASSGGELAATGRPAGHSSDGGWWRGGGVLPPSPPSPPPPWLNPPAFPDGTVCRWTDQETRDNNSLVASLRNLPQGQHQPFCGAHFLPTFLGG